MTDRNRNVIVGLTVLIAFCILGSMIVVFAGMPEMLKRGYKIRILFNSTHNAKKGDSVRLAGVRVGSVTDIAFTDDDPRRGVTFTVLIDHGRRVPANVRPRIHSQGFVGSAYIDLAYDSLPMGDPDAQGRAGFLPTTGMVTITGDNTRVGGLIPPEVFVSLDEIRDDFKRLGHLVETLDKFIAPVATGEDGSQPVQPLDEVLATIIKTGRTLDELHAIIGDKENQANVKAALSRFSQVGADASQAMTSMRNFTEEARASLRETTKSATEVGRGVGELTTHLIDNAEKISTLMATMNRTMTKMESGKGTFGRMANDPKLYNNLADAAEQLNKLVGEMRKLVKTWQSQGIGVKLK